MEGIGVLVMVVFIIQSHTQSGPGSGITGTG